MSESLVIFYGRTRISIGQKKIRDSKKKKIYFNLFFQLETNQKYLCC